MAIFSNQYYVCTRRIIVSLSFTWHLPSDMILDFTLFMLFTSFSAFSIVNVVRVEIFKIISWFMFGICPITRKGPKS